MNRAALLDLVRARRNGFDLIVIGGGATGAGVAWDAASRGLSTLLVERGDFGEGTSSRSTKLIHGGLRYLAQGRLGLVREALQERTRLFALAPHLVRPRRILIPLEGSGDRLKYGFGLACYDLLARAGADSRARLLSRADTETAAPALHSGARGSLCYVDGQFDDTRLLLAVLGRAVALGAIVLNYCAVDELLRTRDGRLTGVVLHDTERGRRFEVSARLVINAAGPQAAAVRALDPTAGPLPLTLSRGTHLVVERRFWPGEHGLLIPRTPDGRVMFVLPWHGHVLLGTTDVATVDANDPRPSPAEVDWILEVAATHLTVPPQRADVRTCFAGVRPLPGQAGQKGTAGLAREYQLDETPAGLVSIVGGKWTTFRRMAEAGVNFALRRRGISAPASRTDHDPLPRDPMLVPDMSESSPRRNAASLSPLAPGLPYTEQDAVTAIRVEMARHIDDILARRTRALFLDAAAALAAAPRVARLLAQELGEDDAWAARELERFSAVAQAYRPPT